jgi:predicted ATP-grasp superfamily ATP-dependent carboligase
MIKSKLSFELANDEYFYFFTMLSDRFIPLVERWQKGLEKRFKKKFKPIYILPFYHNHFFEEENYVVLNEWLEDIHKQMKRTDIMNLIYPEDLNKQFSKSKEIKDLSQKLIKKQGKVFVLSFSDVWFDLDDPNMVLLGPDPSVAALYDAKIEHYRTFEKLGMETIETVVYKDIQELRDNQKGYPFFLSAMYSSGGIESKAIFTDQDLDAYYSHLRPVNKEEPLIAARYIDDIVLAPNSSGIVTSETDVTVVCISDQILRNNQYMGNIYPSQAKKEHVEKIKEMTVAVGKYLAKQDFRGLFGIDFLITKSGKCYPVDLNPRRQGGYYCVAMSSKTDLIELELAVIFDEPIPKLSYEDFQVDYCWAHSKLSPYYPNVKIIDEFSLGSPTEPFKTIGATFKAIYYPKNNTLMVGNPGFYLTSGNSYKEVKLRLFRETEETISKSYELYEG